jgi:AraC-like DNA-binding protein
MTIGGSRRRVLEECDAMAQATETTHGILEPQTGRAHFTLTRRSPSDDLAGHLACHWIVRWDLRGAAPFTQEILPHPCVNLVAEPERIAVYGIPLGRSPHRLEGAGVAVGTKFRPGGIAGFLDRPASDLNGRVLGLGELFGAAGAPLERRLAAAPGEDEHVDAVEDFLRARLPAPDPRYDLVREVVEAMLVTEPGMTVAELAERFAVSQRTLQRAFADLVGVGPKWVLKRYRMHVAAELIAAGEAPDGAALALDLGYFDQPHFVRDFTAQVGVPPSVYERACAAAAAA